ncbi:hypothetical protein ACW4FQ_31005, partial [Escherichia coli]
MSILRFSFFEQAKNIVKSAAYFTVLDQKAGGSWPPVLSLLEGEPLALPVIPIDGLTVGADLHPLDAA